MASKLNKTVDAAKNWEDEYNKLYDQHIQLKQLCNEQEEHIRR